MKLYELSSQYEQLTELLESGEVEQELFIDTLESIEESINVKAENIAKLVAKFESDELVLKNEAKRLTERANVAKKSVERLKTYLSDNLQRAGISKVESQLFTIGFRKSTSVNVFDMDKLSDEYKVVNTNIVPDKKLIGDALKSGLSIDGAELIVNQNLQIK